MISNPSVLTIAPRRSLGLTLALVGKRDFQMCFYDSISTNATKKV